jgi:hypothetical protein
LCPTMQPGSQAAWWAFLYTSWSSSMTSYHDLCFLDMEKRLGLFDIWKVPETKNYVKRWILFCRVKTK